MVDRGRLASRSTGRLLCWLFLVFYVAAPLFPTYAWAAVDRPTTVVPTIDRVAGADRYATAVEISRSYWRDGSSPRVVIATGENYPDGLAAAPLAYAWGGPLLLAKSDGLPPVVCDEIKRLKPQHVFIIGSTDAVGEFARTQLKYRLGVADVVRLGGTDRYATAAIVARDVFSKTRSSGMVLASGVNYPDALAASSLAARRGLPILLSARDNVPYATATRAASIHPASLIIVGDQSSISDRVLSAPCFKTATKRTRLGGSNRYATAVKIADYSLSQGFSCGRIYVATGRSFPDALALGPVAAVYAAPIVLTEPQALPSVAGDYFERHRSESIAKVVMVGGPSSISAEVREAIASHIGVP